MYSARSSYWPSRLPYSTMLRAVTNQGPALGRICVLHGHHAHVSCAHGVHHRVFDGAVDQVGQVGAGESIGVLDQVSHVDAFDGAGLEVVVEDSLSGGAVGG